MIEFSERLSRIKLSPSNVVAQKVRDMRAAGRDVIGLMIGLANGLYLVSTRDGLLSVVAVIVSLYPASTILLAMALDHERVNRSQLVGMALAGIAVAVITIGS